MLVTGKSCAWLLAALAAGAPARAAEAVAASSAVDEPAWWAPESGKLLATSGVSQIEGAGGGGLVPWALITGYGTSDAVGANVHHTFLRAGDYTLHSVGASVGLMDRVELSFDRQFLDTGAAGGRLGLGSGFMFDQSIAGAKVRLAGDAVYDQDVWRPQVSAGVQWKLANRGALLKELGARSADGVDCYLAATKLLLSESLLLDATVRATRANQFGLLGFGGDWDRGYSAEFEGSAAVLLSRRLAVGAEVRTKPDNLGFAHEDDAWDLFGAWFVNKNMSVTLAYVQLGRVARQNDQGGLYLSLQAGF
jgi:hypothetical protein